MLSSPVLPLATLAVALTSLPAIALANGTLPASANATTGRPALLNDAFNALLEHQGRWAYVETHRGARNGRPYAETIFRVDPSAPYAEQNVPLQIRGNPPTEKQLKDAAERSERAAQQRLARQESLPVAAHPGETPNVRRADEVKIWVNGQEAIPQIDRATLLHEDETSVTYEVPLEDGDGNRSGGPLEKFELTARVNKTTRQFERATIRQRASLRVKLIAKVSETVLVFEFGTPDPNFPATLTRATFDTRVALLFGKGRALHGESVRTEFRHVTPYDERFGVKLGTLRTLEL